MAISNLQHKTTPHAALAILKSRQYFCSGRTSLANDAGINFLGVLGEVNNHHLHDMKVKLICTWNGQVSAPLHWENLQARKANLLCDYNGSGKHFQNNDPKYFLPIGSDGLIVNAIEYSDESEILEAWLDLKDYKYFRCWRISQARQAIEELKSDCNAGKITIKVC